MDVSQITSLSQLLKLEFIDDLPFFTLDPKWKRLIINEVEINTSHLIAQIILVVDSST
jgi:hypothetical protein